MRTFFRVAAAAMIGLIGLVGMVGMVGVTHAEMTLNVYGPGGPAPAMKEAAAAFERKMGTPVTVTAGPTPQWIDKAKADADVIYGGAENRMTDFVAAMEGRIAESEVLPLYLRPYSILVRPGSPRKIRGVRHLLKPGVGILVVQGAGQTGAWEDMAGRTGKIETVRALRKNIVAYAKKQRRGTPEMDRRSGPRRLADLEYLAGLQSRSRRRRPRRA